LRKKSIYLFTVFLFSNYYYYFIYFLIFTKSVMILYVESKTEFRIRKQELKMCLIFMTDGSKKASKDNQNRGNFAGGPKKTTH